MTDDRPPAARERALTEQVVRSFDTAASPRFREVLQALVEALHGVARDVRLTEQEWQAGIAFLTRCGDITDERRQEFVLLSDVLGLSMLTVGINAAQDPRATEAKEFGPIFAALGFTDGVDPHVMAESMRARADDTLEAAEQRTALRKALELKDDEFNAHGVELGQRYASGAVVGDGTPEPPHERDPELYDAPTTWPGARLPHAWLGLDGHRRSTHDVCGKGRFTVLTGISGQRWADAARAAGERLGIEVVAHVVGPGREHTDLYDDWSRLREVAEDGCVLVRPDPHVAWRAGEMADDPERELVEVLEQVLDRRAGGARPA
jgi:hypothetical protein